MNFFKKLLGLDPKQPLKSKPIPESNLKETIPNYSMDNVYPLLTNERTTEYKLDNELVRIVHKRENSYANIISVYIFMDPDKSDSNGDVDAFQIITENMSEDKLHNLGIQSEANFDKLALPFSFWNETGEKLHYKILSCPISPSSTSKILSKKHMIEAHEMLNTDELLVSIPLSDVIFVCKSDLNDDDLNHFMAIHSCILLDKNNKPNILCEDLFVVTNGEITAVHEFQDISEELLKTE